MQDYVAADDETLPRSTRGIDGNLGAQLQRGPRGGARSLHVEPNRVEDALEAWAGIGSSSSSSSSSSSPSSSSSLSEGSEKRTALDQLLRAGDPNQHLALTASLGGASALKTLRASPLPSLVSSSSSLHA